MEHFLYPGRLLLAGLLTLTAPIAAAHDMWIEVPELSGAAPYPISLRIGDDPPGEPVRRNPQRILRFQALGADGERSLPGIAGAHPAGYLNRLAEGVTVLSYVSSPAYAELAPETFENYLREEGLEQIVEHRRQAGESEHPGRERYSRSLKALLPKGDEPASGYDRRAGLPLELIPESDPFRASPQPLRLRAEFNGKPLAGLLVELRDLRQPEEKQAMRTDDKGRAELPLGPGRWQAAAVHMQRAAADSDADWRSYWTTLTWIRRTE